MSESSRGSLLDVLHDELLSAIVCTPSCCWTVYDLLHLSRTCKRLHTIVSQACGPRWKQLYQEAFKQPMPARTADIAAMQTFKSRYVEHNQELRLKRRVALMKLRSEVQGYERDLQRVSQQLQAEQRKQRALSEETASLKRTQQVVQLQASSAWVPSVVRQAWDLVVSSAPVQPEWRLKQLDNDLRASKLQAQVLRQQSGALKAKLKDARRKLIVMEAT